MRTKTFSICLLAAVLGCDSSTAKDAAADLKQAANAAEAAAKAKANEVADRIEKRITDEIVCSGKLQPATAARLKEALHGGKALTWTDLLDTPEAVGPVMGFAGSGVATALILARNFNELRGQVQIGEVMQSGWPAAKCGPAGTIACVSGTAIATVVCTGTAVSAIEVNYDKCVTSGPPRSGKVRLAPVANESTAAEVTFDKFYPSETQQISGTLRLTVGLGAAPALQLASQTTLTITEHAGAEAPACGGVLTLHSLKITADSKSITAEFSAAKTTDGKTTTLKTSAGGLTWPLPPTCACPLPGGSIALGFAAPISPAPVVTLQLQFAAAASADTCASLSATLGGWPLACKITESLAKDCGKGALQKASAVIGGALCGTF